MGEDDHDGAGGRVVVRAGRSPRSARTATGPFLVEMCILLSRGAFCTREWRLELHFRVRSARLGVGGARRGLRSTRGGPSGACGGRRLSKSVAKARIAPERAERIVDIPRFYPPPIPPRDAFATDLDTTPPQTATGAPPAPLRALPASPS